MVMPSLWPDAASQAADCSASSARTHQTPAVSAAAATAWLTSFVVGACEDQPCAFDVTGVERTPLDVSDALRELVDDVGRDDRDDRTGLDKPRCPSSRDGAATDDEDALAPQVEEQRQPGVVHPAIVSPPPTCQTLLPLWGHHALTSRRQEWPCP